MKDDMFVFKPPCWQELWFQYCLYRPQGTTAELSKTYFELSALVDTDIVMQAMMHTADVRVDKDW